MKPITESDVIEFKQYMLEKYGRELTDEEALEQMKSVEEYLENLPERIESEERRINQKSILVGVASVALSIVIGVIAVINITGGLIGGIWLLISGGVNIVIYGFIISVLMPTIYTIVSFPSLGLVTLLARAIEKGKIKSVNILASISFLYEKGLLIAWVYLVFHVVVISLPTLPLLGRILWAYSVAISPLAYMARKEGENAGLGTSLGVIYAILAFIILCVFYITTGITSITWLIIGVLILPLLIVMLMSFNVGLKEKNF